jgi:hypothetical protein
VGNQEVTRLIHDDAEMRAPWIGRAEEHAEKYAASGQSCRQNIQAISIVVSKKFTSAKRNCCE